MACCECRRLVAENARLKDEIETWSAVARAERAEVVEDIAATRWTRAFGTRRAAVRLLRMLAERPDRTLSRTWLIETLIGPEVKDPRKQLDVTLVHARAALKRVGLADQVEIQVIHGEGYVMDGTVAGILRAFVGEVE